MRYVVPVVVNWPATVIAVNVGGAVNTGHALVVFVGQEAYLGFGTYCDRVRRRGVL